MKFKYYIVVLHDGSVVGTNDPELANQFAPDEDSFVIDAEAGDWLLGDGDKQEIKDINEANAE